jgi:Lysine methyltransferase
MTESSIIVSVEHATPAEQQQQQEQHRQPFLTIRNIPVYFQEDWGAGIGGGLWSTGLAMAKYLQTDHAWHEFRRRALRSRNEKNMNDDNNDKRDEKMTMVELGSGNGLLSLCWLALFAAIINSGDVGGATANDNGDDSCCGGGCFKNLELIVTDTLDHLPLIQKTLRANQHILEKTISPSTASVKIVEHQWGDFEPRTIVLDKSQVVPEEDGAPIVQQHHKLTSCNIGMGGVDMIVGSDLAYREELYDPLIASFTALSNEHTVILLGCTMADTTPEFFNRLLHAGFVYTRLADHLMDCNFRGQVFGVFVIQKRQANDTS